MKASRVTAIDFFNDLSSTYAKRRFFGVFLGIVVICLLLVYITNILVSSPAVEDIIVSILTEIISGSLIIVTVYALYVFFIGSSLGSSEIVVTRPQDIGERMRTLPLGVSEYIFWGRSGSFFRAYPLLKLDEESKSKKRNIRVEILLPNPDDSRLVKSYREILKSLDEDYDKNSLLVNVLATCMACAIVSANNKYLEIRVHLSRFLPAFRFDASDNGAILTQDDPKKSALYFAYGSEFYNMFCNTMINERNVSRNVVWNEELFDGFELGEYSCDRNTLTAFDIEVTELEEVQRKVSNLITKRPHRYG